ncbi:MAG: hypothetical protein IJA61_00920 [Clostridia bacterium]|nr:hypothetical protein [Clostridia bacterium]
MENKLATYLGFAIKSRQLIYGVDNILEKARKVEIIICDEKLSENSLKKVMNLEKPIYTYPDLDVLLNTTNCKAIAITSKELAKAIKELNILKEV